VRFRIVSFRPALRGFVNSFDIVNKLDVSIYIPPPGFDLIGLEFPLGGDLLETVAEAIFHGAGQ
jgi:hypothetical protein